ncbi:MAG: phosphotransferase [Anaerolineae bacterium]|jgi:uncharacterized protein (TIGR02172 family)|nr:phosphotransferase [Anaerolineae bacterium]
MTPLQRIAIGHTAEVYEYQPGWVLKLFKANYSRGHVEYEFRIHQAVQNAGIPVPKAGDEILEIDGRFGILYEKVNGQPMARILEKQPWKFFAYARKLAQLHVQMHADPMQADGLPTMKERLRRGVNEIEEMPPDFRDRLFQVMDRLPDGSRLCHGDFHVENVLVDGDDFYIIDWVDAAIGSPTADVARTSIILLGAASTLPKVLGWLLVRMHAVYLEEYARLHPFDREEYQHWLPVIAAARLSEGLTDQQEWLIEQAGKLG